MVFKIFLWIGALFFLIEFAFHFFGLPFLEHNKIHIPTHDRYIGIMALTYGVLLILISTDIKKYRDLFILVMVGILCLILNGIWISLSGGYSAYFPVEKLDKDIGDIGYFYALWYPLTWYFWFRAKKSSK